MIALLSTTNISERPFAIPPVQMDSLYQIIYLIAARHAVQSASLAKKQHKIAPAPTAPKISTSSTIPASQSAPMDTTPILHSDNVSPALMAARPAQPLALTPAQNAIMPLAHNTTFRPT
jgi:hypothetical protein